MADLHARAPRSSAADGAAGAAGVDALDRAARSAIAAALVEHAQSAVLGVDEVEGCVDDASQHGWQIEIAPDRHDRIEELPEASRSQQSGSRRWVKEAGRLWA